MILNSPTISGSLTVTGNTVLSGSINVVGGLTGTASFASTATSASYALSSTTASYSLTNTSSSYALASTSASYGLNALTSSNSMTASSADTLYVRNNATVLGSITAQTLVVQTVTSSVLITTGSNIIGSSLSNVQQITGSLYLTGSTAAFAGSVGIGVTSPTQKLDVSGLGVFGAGTGRINIGSDSTSPFLEATSTTALRMYTGGAERMRITSDGKIGFNTNSPFNAYTFKTGGGNNLDIFDTGGSFGIGMQAVNDANTVYKTWDFYASKFQFLNGNAIFASSVSTTALNMNNMASLGSIGGGAIYMPYTAGLFFRTTDGATARGKIQADNSNNIFINSDNGGSVGIGNTSPSTKLHVTGTVSAVDVILSGGGTWTYTTNASWASAYQVVIPYNSFNGGGVYLVKFAWGGGGSPYIVYGATIWMPVQSNGGSQDNEVTLLSSTHQGAAGTLSVRNQAYGGQASSGLLLRLNGFADPSGQVTVVAARLM